MEIMKMTAAATDCLRDECSLPLAYAYVPIQKMDDVYDDAEALTRGTLFPELDKPYGVYGNEFGKDGMK